MLGVYLLEAEKDTYSPWSSIEENKELRYVSYWDIPESCSLKKRHDNLLSTSRMLGTL